MADIIKTFFLILFCCSSFLLNVIANDSETMSELHREQPKNLQTESADNRKLNGTGELNGTGDRKKLKDKLIEESLSNGITIQGKNYRFVISEDIKRQLKNNSSLESKLVKAIEDTQQKQQEIDKRVIGFNIVIFDDVVYIKPFLGPNAK